MGADGEVFGVLEEALAGGVLAEAVGEAGHGVEPAPVDGEGAHAVKGRGLAIDGAGGRPGGAPGELILANLIGGQRGGRRGAAEARGEMGDPAARRTIQGYEAMHMIRKGQARWVSGSDVRRQIQFINNLFEVAA